MPDEEKTDWTGIAARYRDLVDSGVDLGKRPPDETVLVWILRALEVLALAEAERMVERQRGLCSKCGKNKGGFFTGTCSCPEATP